MSQPLQIQCIRSLSATHVLRLVLTTASQVQAEDNEGGEREAANLNQDFLHLLYSLEAPPTSTKCKGCKTTSAAAFYRCKDCFGNKLLCNECTREAHFSTAGDPFHRIEKLIRGSLPELSYFTRASLADPEINGALHLGHHGSPCPHQNPQDSTLVRILDTNGIFTYRVYQCPCLSKQTGLKTPLAHQFFLLGLFPATYETVRTAFTFKALRCAQMHQLCSGESMWDFYEVIRRWTNNVRPDTVPVSSSGGSVLKAK